MHMPREVYEGLLSSADKIEFNFGTFLRGKTSKFENQKFEI